MLEGQGEFSFRYVELEVGSVCVKEGCLAKV